MEKIKIGSSTFLFFVFLISILTSCQEGSGLETTDDVQGDAVVTILETETAMGDILLPIGTSVNSTDDSHIEVELPQGYEFLLFDEKDGVSFSRFGSYSCTCSKSSSCKVFYNSGVGYGCLQSNCTGSCTGTPGGGGSQQRLAAYGIINTTSKELIGEDFIPAGNLTPKGYDLFIEQVANTKIQEFFDFAFAESDYDNAEELIAQEGEQALTYVQLQYMGISFTAAVPAFNDVLDKQIFNLKVGTTVTCSGSNGCTCSSKKKCVLGNCVYYCDGCTTCTMSVNEQ